VRLFAPPRRTEEERLLWSRDLRYIHRLARVIPAGRVIELETGGCLVAPATELTDEVAIQVARASRDPDYGLVDVDPRAPERDRYVVALAAAVQLSGVAARIGMAQSPQTVQTKLLDLFFALSQHAVHFQPIVSLADGGILEYECLFRPHVGPLPATISAIVEAAVETDRSVELDDFIVRATIDRIGQLSAASGRPASFAINVTPAALLDHRFEPRAVARLAAQAGLTPRRLTLEVTEQQAVADPRPLQRQVKALRRLGFGFAVDDAGAGYASFSLVAALRPSIIKIDRQIVRGVSRDDARQALVEAFVSFARRIGATLVAEGIERRADLLTLRQLGVAYGQGFLLGRPGPTLARPRPLASLLRSRQRESSPVSLPHLPLTASPGS
jgi:EAL domain-containing protein (putative c-di-GMP-specific phosphodiesterase class I)